MLAQRKLDVRPTLKVLKSRKRVSKVAKLFSNPMIGVVVLAFVVCVTASAYVGAYAKCSEIGRHRAKLTSDLNRVKKENEQLRLQVVQLRQPERIEMYAREASMIQCQQTAYIGPVEPQTPRNTASSDIK